MEAFVLVLPPYILQAFPLGKGNGVDVAEGCRVWPVIKGTGSPCPPPAASRISLSSSILDHEEQELLTIRCWEPLLLGAYIWSVIPDIGWGQWNGDLACPLARITHFPLPTLSGVQTHHMYLEAGDYIIPFWGCPFHYSRRRRARSLSFGQQYTYWSFTCLHTSFKLCFFIV